MKTRLVILWSVVFVLLATSAFALPPFRVLFDFTRTTGDVDVFFGERQPANSFDDNASMPSVASGVTGGPCLNTQNRSTNWIVLNDTNPNVADSGPSANVNAFIAGTNVVVRTRIPYLYSGANSVTNEGASAAIMFGLTGSGGARSGYLARVSRYLQPSSSGAYGYLTIDEFNNGVRGAKLIESPAFVYGVNTSLYFLELLITSDGITTNATFRIVTDANIPNAILTNSPNRLVEPAWGAAPSVASLTIPLPNYHSGYLGLYAEDNSNGTASNPNNDVVRFSNFYAESQGPVNATVTVDATDDVANESGNAATFVFTRAFPEVVTTNQALIVNYAVSGTASNGMDFPTLNGQITIPVGASNVSLTINPTADGISELAENLTLTVLPSDNYFADLPNAATITILDADPTKVGVYASASPAVARIPGTYGEFTVVRYGDTNAATTVNVNYSGGTAVLGVDFTADTSASFAPGEIIKAISFTPIYTGAATNKSVVLTVVGGVGYTAAPNSTATAVIAGDAYPPEIVLWSDNFDSGTSGTNYSIRSWAIAGPDDYSTNFVFDYITGGFPPAPYGSTNYGFQVSVNKNDATARAAAVNLYPIGQSFSGNFALRFTLMLQFEGSLYEYVLFGINHSGLATNHWSGSYSNFTTGDGIWFAINTFLTNPNSDSVNLFASQNVGDPSTQIWSWPGTVMTRILPSPPFSLAGGAGNAFDSTSKTWVDVELSQVDGIITLLLNRNFVYQATNSTAFTDGNIMLGYDDSFNSISTSGNYAIFDNVRVVRLAASTAPQLTSITVTGSNVQIDFAALPTDAPTSFELWRAGAVNGAYGKDMGAAITSLGGGSFRATTTISGDRQFYQVRRP